MSKYSIVLLVWLLAFSFIGASANDDAYRIGEYILAQDESISSGKGSVSVSRVILLLKDYELVRNQLESLARSGADAADVREASIALVERLSKAQDSGLHSYRSTFFERGECFRETHQSENLMIIQQYDGQRYDYYLPSSAQKQADIWSTPQSYEKCGLKELNIKLGRFFDNAVLSCEAESDGYHVQSKVTAESSHVVHLDFDDEFTLKHLDCEKDGESFLEKWFIGDMESNGVGIPGVMLEVRRLGDTFLVSSTIIDDLQVNCNVADEDLWAALPLDALIVDHRVHPQSIYRLADIVESINSEQNLETADLDIPALPPKPNATVPQPPYEDLRPRVKAHDMADEHEGEGRPAVEETSPRGVIAFALAMLGCVLIGAYCFVVVARKAKRRLGPGGAGKDGAS